MYILGIHTGHDSGACLFKDQELIAFCKEERLTRKKNDGGFFTLSAIDECLEIAGISRNQVDALAMTRMKLPLSFFKKTASSFQDLKRKLFGQYREKNLASQMIALNIDDELELVDIQKLKAEMKLRPDVEVIFSNHHDAHIYSSLKFVDWDTPFLLLSCDGGGDCAQYSAWLYNNNALNCILGGKETLLLKPQNSAASIGVAYAIATEICGFIPNRHEGKLTGLAAFGKPTHANEILTHFKIDNIGNISSDLKDKNELDVYLKSIFKNTPREDIAASIQQALEILIVDWVNILLKNNPVSKIALSGGVFSNVRLNQCVSEIEGVEEVFIFPAMGDDGLPVGACVDFLIRKHGLSALKRTPLTHTYYGKHYSGDDLINAAQQNGFIVDKGNDAANKAAELLAAGQAGAIFYGAMEMGPRALGARSILASPAQRDVNDSINKRLQRTEFMPFAPFVLDEDAEDVYEINNKNRYACEFMTITTKVKSHWAEKIPAVVHVDGTARPQIIKKAVNPLYYDILTQFKHQTGLPTLVNTSFNVHEEPIINTPTEALIALRDNRIDFLVCESGLVFNRTE